jgi:N-acetylglucosaminyl-diphospho-decaprenol L-rhamnosyltransferase
MGARGEAPSAGMTEAVELSLVIVSWNTRELLAQCLASIEAGPPGVPCEVWVVDNASTDGSAALVRERFPQVRLVENGSNVGFAPANNQAIRQARGRYVVLLNSDTEVCEGALEALVAFMDLNPGAGGCGPRLLNADGSLQPSCHPMLTPWREFWRLLFLERLWSRATYRQEKWDPAVPRRVDVIKGACFLLRRAALEQVGPLDEQYFMYTEEVDLCYRLARLGWTLWWVPQAAVVHHGEASSKQVREDMYLQLYRSKIQFYRKTGGEGQARRFKRFVRLAYWPRRAAATLGAPLSPSLAAEGRIYRRLLAELPGM